jgi:arylsulfatase
MNAKILFSTGVAGIMVFLGESTANQRPNIVLILADDMGYSDIGCYGSEISTPNLDNLASKGVRFTQFYNASRCCPTRASLLTGLYQHQAGVGDMVADLGYPSYQGYLNNHCMTLAEVMKMNGYNTYMSGKWHVGNVPGSLPRQRGFDRYFGLIDGAGSYFKRVAYRTNHKQVMRWMLDDVDFNPQDDNFYMTDAIADYAIDFLKNRQTGEKPFFLYLAFTAPHWPLHAFPDDIEKYRGKYLAGWDELREARFRKMKQLGIINPACRLSPRDASVQEWNSLSPDEKDMWDLRMAVYAAMIDRLDRNIGRVLNRIEEMGELRNTLVIFLSDNGGCHEKTKNQGNFLHFPGITGQPDSFDAYETPWANASNTPFRMHKHWVHEGGISTPFLACYPEKIKPGVINTATTGHITDIMPTLLDYAGGRYPGTFMEHQLLPLEGISLRAAFEGKNLRREQPIFWEHEGNRAMRKGDWKLVSQYDNKAKKFMAWELYNLKTDRSELDDRSGTKQILRDHMILEYEKWASRVGVVPRELMDKK